MNIRRLRLTRFRHIGELDVALPRGLVLVTGPGGSGKSTLLEGILWCLFGADGVRGGTASLRGDDAPAATSATVELTVRGIDYRVHRSLDGAVTLHRADELIASGEDVAGAMPVGTFDAFMHASVSGRRELQHMVHMHPPERLRTLARWLGIAQPAAVEGSAVLTVQREIAESDERIRTLQAATALLTQYQPELERARADLALAEADAERLHDEWAQKRQDVETRLAAYHRRADELGRQIERLSHAGASGLCPTCEQPLGEGAELVLSRLDDEVYTAAQDSKWLMQRQAQLTQKPPDLVAAETQRARLRELVEDRAERVARCEQATQELWTVATDRRRALAYLDALRDAGAALPAPAAIDGKALARIAHEASQVIVQLSGGALDEVLLHDDGRIHVLARGRVIPVMAGADEELAALALRIAVMRVLRHERTDGIVILDEPFGPMPVQRRNALLELLRLEAEQVIVCTSSCDDGALRLQLDPDGRSHRAT